MCPDCSRLSHRQDGFLIPVALFILVGMLALAMAVTRLTAQSGSSATLEGLSTQAFYAAESGGQYAMFQIFNGASTRPAVEANCGSLATTVDFSTTSARGLQACEAEVACVADVGADGFYTITSTATCGAGELSAQRAIEISAYMQ